MITVFAISGIPLVFIETLQSLIKTLDILPCFSSNRAFFAISLFFGVRCSLMYIFVPFNFIDCFRTSTLFFRLINLIIMLSGFSRCLFFIV